jgi:hypothetical protein
VRPGRTVSCRLDGETRCARGAGSAHRCDAPGRKSRRREVRTPLGAAAEVPLVTGTDALHVPVRRGVAAAAATPTYVREERARAPLLGECFDGPTAAALHNSNQPSALDHAVPETTPGEARYSRAPGGSQDSRYGLDARVRHPNLLSDSLTGDRPDRCNQAERT